MRHYYNGIGAAIRETAVCHKSSLFQRKAKKDLVDGIIFHTYSAVDNTEQTALFRLRRDQAIRALYFDCCWEEPESPSPLSHTPEKVVIADETMGEWLRHVNHELELIKHGLQAVARDGYIGIRAV